MKEIDMLHGSIWNKIPLFALPVAMTAILEQLFNNINADRVFISAKEKQNMQELVDKLLKATQIPQIGENDVIVTNLRHYEALSQALVAIRRVQKGLQEHISGDFLSQDVRECLHFLGEITGQITTDEVLGNIFSRFCIGK